MTRRDSAVFVVALGFLVLLAVHAMFVRLRRPRLRYCDRCRSVFEDQTGRKCANGHASRSVYPAWYAGVMLYICLSLLLGFLCATIGPMVVVLAGGESPAYFILLLLSLLPAAAAVVGSLISLRRIPEGLQPAVAARRHAQGVLSAALFFAVTAIIAARPLAHFLVSEI